MPQPATALPMPLPPRRLRAGLGLLAAVLLGHLWLLGQWAGGSAHRPSVARSAVPVQLARTVQVAPPSARPAPKAPIPATIEAPPRPTDRPPAPQPRAGVPPAASPEPAPIVAPPDANPARTDSDGEPPGPDGAAPPEPPPIYATVTPAPVNWRYAMTIGVGPAARNGTARLSWQHDGQRYRLALAGEDRGAPLITQESTGVFDAAGIAPERFVDQRRSRRQRSANFQRDSGRITFSGPRIEQPAWPGVQDRLVWIAQLAAIAQAAGGVPPEVTLLVVDARGTADRWTFKPDGAEPITTGMGTTPTVKVLRESPRLQDWRVEAWLDPQRGYWPARLRMSLPRSGAVLELALLAETGP